MIRRFLLGIAITVSIGTLRAEETPPYKPSERLTVETRFLPYSDLKNPIAGSPDEKVQIQPQDIRVRVGLPVIRFPTKKAALTPSISYEQLHFNYQNWNSSFEPYRVDTLQSIGASIFYRQPMAKPLWGFGWFFSTSLASDFKTITPASLRFQGGGFVNRKVSGGSLSFGLALLNNFGRPRVFPVVGFEPDPEAVHKFTVRIPVEASYFYCPPGKWETGIAARVSGMNAELGEAGLYQTNNVAYSVATVGPSAKWKLNRYLALTLDGGWVPYHRFQIVNRRDTLRDFDMKQSYFVATGIRILL